MLLQHNVLRCNTRACNATCAIGARIKRGLNRSAEPYTHTRARMHAKAQTRRTKSQRIGTF